MQADESIIDAQGRTLLHHAAGAGSAQIVAFLVARNHSVVTKDYAGYNALLYAASKKPQSDSLVKCQEIIYRTDHTCAQAETNEEVSIQDFILENIGLPHDVRLNDVDWNFLYELLMRDTKSSLKKLLSKIRDPMMAEQRSFGGSKYGNHYDSSHQHELDFDENALDFNDKFFDLDDNECDVPYSQDEARLISRPGDQVTETHEPWANLANIFDYCTEEFFSANQPALGELLESLLFKLKFHLHSSHHLQQLVCRIINGLGTDVLQALSIRKRQILNEALEYNDSAIVSCLLAKNLNVDVFDNDMTTHGRNAVQIACAYICDLATFQTIIKVSKNIEVVDKFGNGLLQLVASSTHSTDRVAKIEILLKAGLNINHQSSKGETALHIASRCGNLSIVQLLLRNGADASLKDRWGFTPAHCASSAGQVQVLHHFASDKVCWTDTCDLRLQWSEHTRQRTARGAGLLHLAARCGSVKCIVFLLGFHGLFDVNGTPDQDLSPLQVAIYNNWQPAAGILLAFGARIASMPWEGLSLLHIAAQRGNATTITMLLSHDADITVTDKRGFTPLEYAVQKGHMKVAKLIKARISEIPNTITLNQVLGLAIECGDLEECKKLILDGASLHEPCSDQTKLMPVLHALYNGRSRIAKYLVEAGAPCDEITPEHLTTHGATALHYCIALRDGTLLDRVLDACPELLFLETDVHPVHLAIILQENNYLYTMLSRISECWKRVSRRHLLLRSDGGRVSDKKQSSTRPSSDLKLHKIALLRDPSLVKDMRIKSRLPRRRAEVQIRNAAKTSNTVPPLDIYDGQLTDTESMVFRDRIASQIDQYLGNTPLHCAARVSNVTAVKLLISYGAKLNSLSSQRTTPFTEAVLSGSNAVVLALLDSGSSVHGYDERCRGNVAGIAYWEDSTVLDRLADHICDMRNVDLHNINLVAQYASASSANALLRLGMNEGDLTAPDNIGVSAVQRCIYHGKPSVLCYILNAGFDLSASTAAFGNVLNMNWIDGQFSALRRLLRRLGRKKSVVLLNTKPEYRQTLLYNAAAMDQPRILNHLLTYPVDLDLHGGPLGSALMAAATYGRLEAVQILVNAGASITHRSSEDDSLTNALMQAKFFPDIQRWLLVDRFKQTKWLTNG